jgi:hypothetical protein
MGRVQVQGFRARTACTQVAEIAIQIPQQCIADAVMGGGIATHLLLPATEQVPDLIPERPERAGLPAVHSAVKIQRESLGWRGASADDLLIRAQRTGLTGADRCV